MVDYDKPTGSRGTLRIRDTGSTVEFWILCSDPATNVGSLAWSGTVNGVPVGGAVHLSAGFSSRMVGSWAVSTTQTVSFGIGASGTSGLAGPTSHSAAINRGAPEPPILPPNATVSGVMTEIGLTSMNYRFGYGGGRVLYYQAQYDVQPNLDGTWIYNAGDGIFGISGLPSGRQVWARSRGVNEAGPGPWGAYATAVTLSQMYVGKSVSFVPSPTTVGRAGAFVIPELRVGRGGSFVPLG